MIPAHSWFFPAAAAYATAAPLLLGLVHAQEMVFGFGLAVVAGNQLGPVGAGRLALLFGAWVFARIAFHFAPVPWINAPFAILLALQLVPRLVAPIRKWRNRALPFAVALLCAVAVWGHALAGILVLALLMLFVAGRILAPYAAVRVQPRFEALQVVLLFAAMAALAAPRVAGMLLLLAAAVSAVRLARWRLWRSAMAVGYAWLVAGLAAVGASLLMDVRPVAALHLITIGAMGTLTINVMALTYARLARIDPARLRLPWVATAFIAAATAARLGNEIVFAAGCWSTAYLLLLVTVLRVRALKARTSR